MTPLAPRRPGASAFTAISVGLLIACALSVAAATRAQPPAALGDAGQGSTSQPSNRQATNDPPGWRLAWSDDFDRFDEQRWEKSHNLRPTNHSLQAYLPEQVDVEDGCLVITAIDRPEGDLPYRSGLVQTRAAQRLGRWEVRAKLPTTAGMWPAIWLLPDVHTHRWPSGGEIDIMENRGNQPTVVSSAFHYGSSSPFVHHFLTDELRVKNADGAWADYHADFHTYAVDWTERLLRFYVDGVCHFVVDDRAVDGFLSREAKPAKLILNNAVGGDFLPNPDATTRLPQRMLVDWVRVYEPAPGAGPDDWLPPTLVNADFEADGGSMAGWTRFGGNNSDPPTARVTRSHADKNTFALRLSGQSSGGVNYSGVTQGVRAEPGSRVVATASLRPGSPRPAEGVNATLKLEFYRVAGGRHGTDDLLGEQATDVPLASQGDAWQTHEVAATTPAGAVETRVSLVFTQSNDAPGSVLIEGVRLSSGSR